MRKQTRAPRAKDAKSKSWTSRIREWISRPSSNVKSHKPWRLGVRKQTSRLRNFAHSLRPHDEVRLLFVNPSGKPPFKERMWVRVLSGRDGKYHGKLMNDPAVTPNLKYGDRITFESKHVIDGAEDVTAQLLKSRRG